jgi:hypothetical protein
VGKTTRGPDAGADRRSALPEFGPCEHVVQFHEGDDVLVQTLTAFVSGALDQGDTAVVIATPRHRQMLEESLNASGIDVVVAQAQERITLLDAEATLRLLLKDGWPDDEQFGMVVKDLLSRGKRRARNVRIFGEMVALLWERGARGATIRLEHLWENVCTAEGFPVLCAYPNGAFTQKSLKSRREICQAHSRVLAH